tara:strand:- start:294 stop:1175 length:882 start_codon:yes stop_codon:yes gene_type:complete
MNLKNFIPIIVYSMIYSPSLLIGGEINLYPYSYEQRLLAQENNDDFLQKSSAAIKNGNYKEAIKYGTRAIDLNPNSEESYFYRGIALSLDKNFLSAINDFSKAIELNPKAVYFLVRGESFYKSNNKLDALSDFQKVIEIGSTDRNLSMAHTYIGTIKSDFGDHDNAIISFSKAIELNPQDFEAYNNRAKSKSLTKDFYGAIDDLKKMLEINENSFYPYYALGIMYGQYLKRYSKAIFFTEKALIINPNSSDALHNLGYWKQMNGNFKDACENYKKANNLGDPKSFGLMRQLGC